MALGQVCEQVSGRRVGLLAHPASVTRTMINATQVLRNAGAHLEVFFGPEHGYGGEQQDMIGVASDAPKARGSLPTFSLYGKEENDLYPKKEWLEGLDAVVIDLQDVGSRYYTFVWTAAIMLKEAAKLGVETIVLDRPNPLGGLHMEGAPQRPGYRSFVGYYDVPVRHGMTIGEICTMVRELEAIDKEGLHVVPMQGWQREMLWPATGLPWVLPSPNMPTFDTALVYPGGCLVEGTRLSEGRGTTRPFEIWGAPYVNPAWLTPRPGAELRALSFKPTFHKHYGKLCRGVQVHVTDAQRFEPYAAYLHWLHAIRTKARSDFQWRSEEYEFVTDRPAIDLLTGGPEFRESIVSDKDLDYWLESGRKDVAAFAERRADWLLY